MTLLANANPPPMAVFSMSTTATCSGSVQCTNTREAQVLLVLTPRPRRLGALQVSEANATGLHNTGGTRYPPRPGLTYCLGYGRPTLGVYLLRLTNAYGQTALCQLVWQ